MNNNVKSRFSWLRRRVVLRSSFWRRSQQDPPKRWYSVTSLHIITTLKTSNCILTAVKTSNRVQHFHITYCFWESYYCNNWSNY